MAIDEATGDWTFLPENEVGTLVLRGPNIFAGYLVGADSGRSCAPTGSSRTAGLTPATSPPSTRDGFIRLAGRAKDLIIRGGHNIDPATIEDALLEHPDVTAAAAVGRPDPHAGEVPVAFVTLLPGAERTPDELEAWAADHVPERAAAPKHVEIIDEIPLTAVGKPYKPELRRRAAEQAARDAARRDRADRPGTGRPDRRHARDPRPALGPRRHGPRRALAIRLDMETDQ